MPRFNGAKFLRDYLRCVKLTVIVTSLLVIAALGAIALFDALNPEARVYERAFVPVGQLP